jgi:hypothetical protein
MALCLEARSRALLSAGEDDDSRYREATDRLGRTRVRKELARSHRLPFHVPHERVLPRRGAVTLVMAAITQAL